MPLNTKEARALIAWVEAAIAKNAVGARDDHHAQITIDEEDRCRRVFAEELGHYPEDLY